MEDIEKEVFELIKNLKMPPFLFIGSGLSRRYVGTPTWENLLREFTKRINNGEFAYEAYINKAKSIGYSTCLEAKIASLLEEDYNDKWFNEDKFGESREINKLLVHNHISPFKIDIADYFKQALKDGYCKGLENEIKLFEKVGDRSIVGIITTNYDMVIETILSKYKYSSYIGQEELLFNSFTGIGEIFKIHGSCEKPQSIVINERDYENYNEKNAYLVAKLLTIFIEHPIIFIGYRIEDPNIKEILTSIAKCLSKERLKELRNRFIFIDWNNTDEPDSISTYECGDLGAGKSLTMVRIFIKDFSILYEALLQNKVTYNPRMIKKLKNDIYKIVVSSEVTESVKVLVDVDDSRLDELETVVGFSVIEQLRDKGYDGIEPLDLFYDVIYNTGFNGNPLNNKKVVETSLPRILIYDQSIPMHKYISRFKGKLDEKIIKNYKLKYEDYLSKGIKNDIKNKRVKEIDIDDIRAKYSVKECLKLIPKMKKEYIEIDKLHKFIVDYLEENPDALINKENQNIRTDLKRLIKIYDFLKYKK